MTDREIYERVRDPLMRFASSLVGPDRAADLVSEVVVATLQRRTLTSLENPEAYLMQAVVNRARSAHRRTSRERDLARRHAPSLAHDDPSTELAIRDEVARAIAVLPVRQRAALFLVYWEDLTPSEAAERLGVKPATLRRYLHLARRKIEGALDE